MSKFDALGNLGLFFIIFLVLGHLNQCKAKPVKEEGVTCGFPSCPEVKKGYINVHLIPHTHDDVGWLKTVDQYFFGSNSDYANAGVQYILDSVIRELDEDPEKRFIYVETAFFWKWWVRQDEKTQSKVKNLVASGRLEFISGAWSMHDEAAAHYHSVVDMFAWGLRKLNDTFGSCGVPRVGWQIDPFGHARETASLMARLGFDGLFFSRIDFRDKNTRKLNQQMELVWEASQNLGDKADLFTSIQFDTYYPPDGFCLDLMCGEEPIIDDVESPDYNADRMALKFLGDMADYANVYRGSNLAVPMGGDFNYQAAHVYFVNIDRLIKAVNDQAAKQNSLIRLIYSTPSCYLKALNDEGLVWSTKQDDFFPYGSIAHSEWTGFYTSRPALKRYERFSNNFLQVAKQLAVLSNLGNEAGGNLDLLREAVGVLQHHDAISGTAKQHVTFDYGRQLSRGFDEASLTAQAALNKLISKTPSSTPLVFNNCLLLNVSQCDVSESSETFVVTVYNPLSRKVSRYIRFPVSGNGKSYTVYSPDGKVVPSQVVPIPDAVANIPGRTSKATTEVVFQAVDLPSLGFRSFFVQYKDSALSSESLLQIHKKQQFTIGFQGTPKLTFDTKTGLPIKIQTPAILDTKDFEQNFFYYQSAAGNNDDSGMNRSSGAYIFRPNSTLIPITQQPIVKHYKGPLVEEVHQQFSDWVSQVIRVYKGEENIEFNWVIGPIPLDDGFGKEIVSNYNIDLKSDSTFYTDSNGREMLKRVKNYQPTYDYSTLDEPIAGNYYPITTRIFLKDDNTQFSVITDRSEGGSSLADGELELMLHRRILNDDGYGVGEALNETAYGTGLVVRGTHYLTGGSVVNQSAADRRLVQQRVLDAWTFFTPTDLSLAQWQDQYNMEFSGLTKDLPDNTQVLTLEPWKDNTFLIRLENILEKDDNPTAAEPVQLNLEGMFNPFNVTWRRETSLGANQWKDEMTRLTWNKEYSAAYNQTLSSIVEDPSECMCLMLYPMDIRTYVLEVSFDQ